MKENEFNEAVMLLVQEKLNLLGINTLLVAPEKSDVSLSTRTKRANEANATVYISIHANAYGNDWNTANGFESYVYSLKDTNTVNFAKNIHIELVKKTGLFNRGLKEANFQVLRETKMPAVLLECGFMTNKKEAELLRSTEYRIKVAEGIVKGITNYFNIDYTEPQEVEEVRYNTLNEIPESYKATVQKLINKGLIVGNGAGLNLTEDMLRVLTINDRAGVYGK